jgi:L-threonylcarbamoyladenylate synthase
MTPPVVPDGPEAREEAAEVLRRGGVVAIPTDTVYGLAAARDDPSAVGRVLEMKGRPPEKGIALLLADRAQAAAVGHMTPLAERLGAALWPGGLTLVVPARRDAAIVDAILGADETIGLRVPDHASPRRIAELVGPFAATSANLAGQPPAPDAAAVAGIFGDAVDLILHGGPATGGLASTVIDCTTGTPRFLRLGAIDAHRVQAVLGRSGVGR